MLPWASRYLMIFGEFPSHAIATADAKEISDSRADIYTGVTVGVWLWSMPFKDVLPVIRGEWATVLPLCVTNFASVVNSYPAAFADRGPVPFI